MKKRKSKKTATSIKFRKTRFINQQRHKASCGPVAITNLLKWFGIQTSYDIVLRFCMGIRAYDPKLGMWPFQMKYLLRTLQIKFKVRRRASLEDIDKILEKDGSIILIYLTKRKTSHAVFIDSKKDDFYRIWNRMRGALPWCPKNSLKRALERSQKDSSDLYVFIFQPLKVDKKDCTK